MGTLAQPVVPLPAATRCLAVDEYFHVDGERSSLLVVDPERPGRVGLVSRPSFLQAMSGRFGFGRALLGNAPISRVAHWDPVVIEADTTVQQAAGAVLQRDGHARYDDLVVSCPDGSWGILSAAAVLEALSHRLAEQAMYDGLTGLANRELLLAELGLRLAAPSQAGVTALMFIDLDRFKQVNDVYGHNAGDLLLQAIAGRLRAAARPEDLVARLGGDEFAVLLTSTLERDEDAAQTANGVAHRLLTAVAGAIAVGGVNLRVGASIGVALAAADGSDADTLLREADLAMYQAKRAGGDRVHLVCGIGRQLAPPLVGLAIDDTLSRALGRREFVLHYQPIKALADGHLFSVEALIRWQDPRHGLRTPGEFLPAAEASGLIVAVDCWVLAEACNQLVRWDSDPAVLAPQHVNVNVSAAHLRDPALLEHVLQALEHSRLAPARLRLELPESASLSTLHHAAPVLNALHEAGVKVILDDLGAGSSTLRHLSDLHLDGIKIDRSFINGLALNDRDHAVVRLLIDLAHNLDLEVTAEGVETAEQLQTLIALGCTYGQGYHLGRPVPADQDGAPPWLGTPASRAPGLCGSATDR